MDTSSFIARAEVVTSDPTLISDPHNGLRYLHGQLCLRTGLVLQPEVSGIFAVQNYELKHETNK